MAAINERLKAAARAGSEAELKCLLREPRCNALSMDMYGMTALMWAAYRGHEACVQLLLPVSNARAKNELGATALMQAAGSGKKECVELLMPVSNTFEKDKQGTTALMIAAFNGDEACVRLLLPASDALCEDEDGLTASGNAHDNGYNFLAQFIDAYVLAQSERDSIEAAASPGATCKLSTPRL